MAFIADGEVPGLEWPALVETYGRYLAGDREAHRAWAALHCSRRGKALARLAPEVKKAMDETEVRAYRPDGTWQATSEGRPAVVKDAGLSWSWDGIEDDYTEQAAAQPRAGKSGSLKAVRKAARKAMGKAEKAIRAEANAEVLVSLDSPDPRERELAWQLHRLARAQASKSADPWRDARGTAAVLAYSGASPHHPDPQVRELYWRMVREGD